MFGTVLFCPATHFFNGVTIHDLRSLLNYTALWISGALIVTDPKHESTRRGTALTTSSYCWSINPLLSTPRSTQGTTERSCTPLNIHETVSSSAPFSWQPFKCCNIGSMTTHRLTEGHLQRKGDYDSCTNCCSNCHSNSATDRSESEG